MMPPQLVIEKNARTEFLEFQELSHFNLLAAIKLAVDRTTLYGMSGGMNLIRKVYFIALT